MLKIAIIFIFCFTNYLFSYDKNNISDLIRDANLDDKHLKNSIKLYFKALELSKSKHLQAVIYNKIALFYLKLNNVINSIDILKIAISNNSFNENTYLILAEIYASYGLVNKSIYYYSKAYKLNNFNIETLSKLATYNKNIFNYEESIFYYEKLYAIDNSIDNLKNLVYLYLKLKRYNKINIMNNINSPEILILLADLNYRKSNYNLALNYYNKALRFNSQNIYIYFSIYLTLLHLHEISKAEILKKFINLKFSKNVNFNYAIEEYNKLITVVGK